MKMKNFKERVLRQKDQPNIYMQKTQGPKFEVSSPNVDLKFKSQTLLNKQNQQPNVPKRVQKPVIENTFGAAKMMMRQSADDLKLHLNKANHEKTNQKQMLISMKNSIPKFNQLSKSNNFERCATERNLNTMNAFSKKHLKTEEYDNDECPIIEHCEFIRSQYESSDDSNQASDEKLNYAKSFNGPLNRQNTTKNILIHESLNYDQDRPRQLVTFGPSEAKNIKKYQFLRQEQKKIKNDVVNKIMMKTKAEMMRSCDFDTLGSLICVNHANKKAKYRLNAVLTDEEQEYFYCSKCAVNLAKQGFDIQEISALDKKMIMSRQPQRQLLSNSVEYKSQNSYHQEEIANFEKRLENLKDKVSSKLNIFNQKSEQMTKIDKKIQQTVLNYDRLIEILKQMKNQEISKENKMKKEKALDINMKKQELSTILDSLNNTYCEVKNQKGKIMWLKNNQFSSIFNSYIKRISSYEEYLTNLERTQLAQDIAAFDANLQSEQVDQETLINQIFDQMYERLSRTKIQVPVSCIKQNPPLRRFHDQMNNNLQSGGSSMFYCEEQDENENRPPFRILFENSKAEQVDSNDKSPNLNFSNTLNESFNVNSSIENPGHRSVKYFKEENYIPNFIHHQ